MDSLSQGTDHSTLTHENKDPIKILKELTFDLQ